MQVLVIGAGVVGLAIGREAALAGHDVVIAEAEGHIGSGTSSRNSEVIHAGIYYPTGSLRERHCARSRRLLYAYCASHGVPHRKLGKLVVVGKDADRPALEKLYAQAMRNGVEGLRMLEGAEAMCMEPALACVAAFHSPETGIIDSHRYMLALQGDLEDRGGVLALNTPVERLVPGQGGWEVRFGGSEPGALTVDAVVNSAGHGAQAVARATEGYPPERVPKLMLAKGNYFAYAGKPAFTRLIYPAPVPGGLGVHVTLDLAGRMRFGPDVEWIDHYDHAVDPRRGERDQDRREVVREHRDRDGGRVERGEIGRAVDRVEAGVRDEQPHRGSVPPRLGLAQRDRQRGDPHEQKHQRIGDRRWQVRWPQEQAPRAPRRRGERDHGDAGGARAAGIDRGNEVGGGARHARTR